MAVYTSNSVNYYLRLPASEKAMLGTLRHWENVKIGYEEHYIWIKDLDVLQVQAREISIIPVKQVYRAEGGKLFPKDSLLPERNIPSLLWTPLERGLQVSLPAFNHNFFGLQTNIEIQLVPTDAEQNGFVLLLSLKLLESYLITASAIRLLNLQWTIIGGDALIMGSPLLPLPGKIFWRREDHLLPAGYDFELYSLSGHLNDMINPSRKHWIIWNESSEYSNLPKEAFKRLTRGSFRSTAQYTAK